MGTRLWLGLFAVLLSAPALAQERAVGDPVAARIAAATEALAQYKTLNNSVWSGLSYSKVDDNRPGLSRVVHVRAMQIGVDRNIESPFTLNDQLVLGVAGSGLDAESRLDARNTRIDSRGWNATGYGVYAPYVFLSFPFSVSYGKWSIDQTRDGTPLLPQYRTEYDSASFATSAGVALTLPVSRFLLTSSVTHRYSRNTGDPYNEAINPLATDYETTPGEVTRASQVVGGLRLALPFEVGRVWVSAGYAYDLTRFPVEDTRSEFPLGAGIDLFNARWLVGAAGQVVLRNDITSYVGGLNARLRF